MLASNNPQDRLGAELNTNLPASSQASLFDLHSLFAGPLGFACDWTKLDATDMGHHLYESLGFRDEQPVERWKRAPAGGNFRAPEMAFAMDAELVQDPAAQL